MESEQLQNLGRLSDRIYNIVKKEIVSGRLAPGQHLALEEIAQNLGVSTTPVRDALSLLAADGLVEWRPRRGAYVAHLTPKAVEEIYQVREFLECCTVDFAIAQGSTVAAEMKSLALQIAAAEAEEDDRARYASLELRFHALPIESMGNAKLLEIYSCLNSAMSIAFTLYRLDVPRGKATLAEHEAIADAIARGDAQAARDAIRTHLQNAKAGLLAQLGDDQASE